MNAKHRIIGRKIPRSDIFGFSMFDPRESHHYYKKHIRHEEDEIDDKIEVQEGESLEDIKAKLKPKKAAISAEMLDTANTYDDKVALVRMIVTDEAGRVANVFKQMMREDLEVVK